MLAGAGPKTKSGADKHTDDQQQSAHDNNAADNTAAPQAAQQAAQVQASTQPQVSAKPAKDPKIDDSSDPTVAQAAPDTAVDPSAVITVAMQPQQPVPTANDNDGDDTVDAAAATAPAGAAPAAPQANQSNNVDTDTDADTASAQVDAAKQTQPVQQAAAQAQPVQPVQPKPVAKAAKPLDATDKAAPRKTATADAGDGVKAAQAEPKTAASAPQAAAGDAKAAAQAQQQAPDFTVTGLAALQNQSGVPQHDAAAQVSMPAQHIEVTAQPNVPALAVEIAAKSQSGARQFDIRLDPPELGRVEVRLSIDATGKASAHLSADQPQTLDLLQKDAPALTRALRDAGLDVSQDGLNFSLRQQGQDSGQGAMAGNRGRIQLSAIATGDASTNATSAYRAPLNGRLDIRV